MTPFILPSICRSSGRVGRQPGLVGTGGVGISGQAGEAKRRDEGVITSEATCTRGFGIERPPSGAHQLSFR